MMNGVTIIWWDWVRWCKGEECNHNVLLDVLLLIMLHKWSPRHPRLLWTDPTRGWHVSNLSRAGVALGELFASQVFNKLCWGTTMELRFPNQAPGPLRTPPFACLIHPTPSPQASLRPSPIILSPLALPLFHPHSTSFLFLRSACVRSTLPSFLQHMPGLLGQQLQSKDFIWNSSSGRHYKDHRRALRLMLH